MEQHKQGLLHKPQIIGISLLIEKGIYGLGYFGGKAEVGHWNGNGKGWDQGALEHGKRNMLKFKVHRGAQEPKQRQKREKPRKRKSCENQGVTNLPPLE